MISISLTLESGGDRGSLSWFGSGGLFTTQCGQDAESQARKLPTIRGKAIIVDTDK